jgi:hypothetical protein
LHAQIPFITTKVAAQMLQLLTEVQELQKEGHVTHAEPLSYAPFTQAVQVRAVVEVPVHV